MSALLGAVLASDALDALEAQTQESARLKARADELEMAMASNEAKPSEAEAKMLLTTHSTGAQASSIVRLQPVTPVEMWYNEFCLPTFLCQFCE